MSVSSAKSVWLGRAESFINPQEFKIFSGGDDTVSYLLNQYMDAVIYFTYDNDVMRLELTNDKYEENILPQASLDRVGVEGKWQFSDDEEKQKFNRLLKRAERSKNYETEGIWFRSFSQCCGYQECCLIFQLRMVAKHDNEVLYCALLYNDTEMQHSFKSISDNEAKFRMAAEQANIYAWEYDIATHEMRPCTRCMRDLGLPPVVENYPDLKASPNMMQLSEEITSTENKIAFARQHYNDSVTEYNTYRQFFPNNLLANSFGHHKDAALLEFDDKPKIVVAPEVKFTQ